MMPIPQRIDPIEEDLRIACTRTPARSGTCNYCGLRFSGDIWEVQLNGTSQRIGAICGECRYFFRHNRLPGHEKIFRPPVLDENSWFRRGFDPSRFDEELVTPQTQGRFLPTEVVSVRHAELLIELEREQRLD